MSDVYGNCPFCEPTQEVIKHNSLAQVLLSDPRKVPGHILVMPKRHVEKPWELTRDELQDIFALIFEVEQKLIGEFGDGADIRQNYRPFMKQNELKVDHLLFHVIPRSLDDYVYRVSEKYDAQLFATLDGAEHDAVATLLHDD